MIGRPSLSLAIIHIGLSRVYFFSICTLFGLLRSTRYPVLHTHDVCTYRQASVLLVSSLSPGQNREDMAFPITR